MTIIKRINQKPEDITREMIMYIYLNAQIN